MNGTRRGRRLEGVERRPDRGVADGVDLGRDAARRRALDPLARARSGSVIQTPRRRSGASGRSGSGSMSSSSAAVRDPSEPSAKHFCQPTRARPAGVRAEDRAAAQPAGERRVERVVAQRGEHPDRQPAALGQVRVGRVRPVQVRVRRQRPRVVDGDDAERQERERHGHDPALELGAGDRRDVARHEPRGRLVQHALGRAVARRAGSTPPAGSARRPVEPGRRAARRGWRAARGGRAPRTRARRPGATGSRSSAVGQRPQRSDVPAVALEPGIRDRPSAACAAPMRASPSASVAASDRSTWRVASAAPARCRCASVRPGDRHLVGLERDPLGERVGARLERDLGPGERDPAVADADRLDPAEPALAGERGDPPGDRACRAARGQASGSASSATSPARSSPAPSPSASATRALTAHRWPTGSAPARIHSAPPPGKA